MNPVQFQALMQQIQGSIDAAHSNLRTLSKEFVALKQTYQKVDVDQRKNAENINRIMGVVEGLKSTSGQSRSLNPDLLYIEEIPGRRIPFELLVTIEVPANTTTVVSQPYTLSMDGPFVATSRHMAFLSTYSFQVTNVSAVERFVGRSYGRWRPISSMLDILDGKQAHLESQDLAFSNDAAHQPANLRTAAYDLPRSASPYRSMEFDGYVTVKTEQYPRQNQQVPTCIWAPGWSASQELSTPDFFAQGEVINFEVLPTHVNNPTAGNIQNLFGSVPYLAAQYDGHEGIMPASLPVEQSGVADSIQRNPSGIIVIGYSGYRILQPAGVRLR